MPCKIAELLENIERHRNKKQKDNSNIAKYGDAAISAKWVSGQWAHQQTYLKEHRSLACLLKQAKQKNRNKRQTRETIQA